MSDHPSSSPSAPRPHPASHPASAHPAHHAQAATLAPPKPAPALPITSIKRPAIEQAPISLVEEADTKVGSKIQAFGVAAAHGQRLTFKRTPNLTGFGSIRIRTFHGRLSDEGLAFMDDKINEWLDGHPEIEIKNVTSTVGLYDGKIKEPALILNVWY
jgi:hypothetical protein